MKSTNLSNNEKIEVTLIKGGCCSSTTGFDEYIGKANTLLKEISKELGNDILVKEITFSDVLNGSFPDALKIEGWEIFTRDGKSSIPMIIYNGKIISTGLPDKDVIKSVLQNAGKIKV